MRSGWCRRGETTMGETLALATDGGLVVVRVAHVDDDGLQALVVRVVLARGALVALVKRRWSKWGSSASTPSRILMMIVKSGVVWSTVPGDDVANSLRSSSPDGRGRRCARWRESRPWRAAPRCGRCRAGSILLVKIEVLAGLLVVGLLLGDELVDVDLAGGVVDGDARQREGEGCRRSSWRRLLRRSSRYEARRCASPGRAPSAPYL